MKIFKLSDQDTKLLLRLLKENIRKYRTLYSKAAISMIILAISTALTAWAMRVYVNKLFALHSFKEIFYVSIAIFLIFTIKGLATYFQILYLERAGNSLVANYQRAVYDKLCRQSLDYFQEHSSSNLLLHITTIAQQTRAALDILITTYIRDLISLISLCGFMLYSNIYFSIASLIVGSAVYLLVSKGLRKIRQLAKSEINYFGQIITVIQESVQGIKIIKAYGLENEMRSRMNRAIKAVEECCNSIAKLRALTNPIMESLAGLAIAFICSFSGYLMLKKGSTPGDLIGFITALLMAYEPAKRLANSSVGLKANITGVHLLFDILDAPIKLTENPCAINIPETGTDHIAIKFEHVSFTYPSLEEPALQNINLEIPRGTTTALVGESGAGKSSIINLLLRFYDPSKGAIYINGIDIKTVSFSSLQQHIAYVGQDSFLFQETIKYNLALARKNATMAEIIEAAKIANAHEFIMQLPNRYDTILGAGGVELSGGQKQRLALSRAVLHKSPVLILDEATSALDSVSEQLISRSIEQLARNHTIIAIAHRFSTIINADNIIVLEKGQIIEQGSLAQLLAQKDSMFKKFYDLQFTPKI